MEAGLQGRIYADGSVRFGYPGLGAFNYGQSQYMNMQTPLRQERGVHHSYRHIRFCRIFIKFGD